MNSSLLYKALANLMTKVANSKDKTDNPSSMCMYLLAEPQNTWRMTALRGKTGQSITTAVCRFHYPFPNINRKSKQKISKDTEGPNSSVMNLKELTFIEHSILPAAEYTFFPRTHGIAA